MYAVKLYQKTLNNIDLVYTLHATRRSTVKHSLARRLAAPIKVGDVAEVIAVVAEQHELVVAVAEQHPGAGRLLGGTHAAEHRAVKLWFTGPPPLTAFLTLISRQRYIFK